MIVSFASSRPTGRTNVARLTFPYWLSRNFANGFRIIYPCASQLVPVSRTTPSPSTSGIV